MFYTLIKHEFLTNRNAQGPIYIIKLYILPLRQNRVELHAKLQMDQNKRPQKAQKR